MSSGGWGVRREEGGETGTSRLTEMMGGSHARPGQAWCRRGWLEVELEVAAQLTARQRGASLPQSSLTRPAVQ